MNDRIILIKEIEEIKGELSLMEYNKDEVTEKWRTSNIERLNQLEEMLAVYKLNDITKIISKKLTKGKTRYFCQYCFSVLNNKKATVCANCTRDIKKHVRQALIDKKWIDID